MESKSIQKLINRAVEILQRSAIPRPCLEAEILLAFVLNCSRVSLHSKGDREVEEFFAESFFRLIKRRSLYEPIEYLTEKVSFYGEELYVSQGALIPRPETEILVDKALGIIAQYRCKNIAEIGIGSGAISVILAHLSGDSSLSFHASDISPEALFNARVNQMRFNVVNLTLHHSAYLDFNTQLGVPFDLLISNPPYIKNNEKLPESLTYEPKCALFGGERGDEVLLKVIDTARAFRIPYLVCEMGYDQQRSVQDYFGEIPHKSLEFYQDLAGLSRGFVAEF